MKHRALLRGVGRSLRNGSPNVNGRGARCAEARRHVIAMAPERCQTGIDAASLAVAFTDAECGVARIGFLLSVGQAKKPPLEASDILA